MNGFFSGLSDELRTIRNNSFGAFGFFSVALLVILIRLFQLQYLQTKMFTQMANDLHVRKEVILAERGRILDRNNEVIAFDDIRYTIFVDPTMVRYPNFIARQLAPVLNMPVDTLYQRMTGGVSYITINADVPEIKALAIERLNYAGIQVNPAGFRYIPAVNIQLIPRNSDIIPQLSEALNVPAGVLNHSLADLMQPPAEDSPKVGVRYLPEECTDSEKIAVEQLHYPGISFIKSSKNYQVGVDPRIYLSGNAPMPVTEVANSLSPLLDMPVENVVAKMTFRTRYVILKRDLTMDMQQTISKMQATLFAAETGVLNDHNEQNDKQTTRLNDAIERLDTLLNGKKGKKSRKVIITEKAIRQRLSTNQPRGKIIVKMVNTTNNQNGKPDKRISYSLYNVPILGVIYGLPGIGIEREPRRFYPYKSLASASIGWVQDGKGIFGLEATENELLNGVNGAEQREVDNWLRTLPESSKRVDPINGLDIKLTIDISIQQAAEEVLEAQVKAQRALQGQCVVLDAKNGEVLALATSPAWDANHPGNSKIPRMNTVVNNYYEPGSTFKAATVAAALETGTIRDGEIVVNCTGRMVLGKRTISEAHGQHGPVTCETLISKSCNIGAAKLALNLGPEKFIELVKQFGFGQRTGIEIAHESRGSFNPDYHTARITLANMGFGQSLAVTPLQMTAYYAALANNGIYHQPHLVKSKLTP